MHNTFNFTGMLLFLVFLQFVPYYKISSKIYFLNCPKKMCIYMRVYVLIADVALSNIFAVGENFYFK